MASHGEFELGGHGEVATAGTSARGNCGGDRWREQAQAMAGSRRS